MSDNNVFEEYFKNSKDMRYDIALRNEITYCETIDKFYDECIKEHVTKLYVNNKDNLIKWHEFIMNVVNKDVPIYWIRKYESQTSYGTVVDEKGSTKNESGNKYVKSTKDKDKYITRWNTRRGALTIVTNEEGKPQYGYVFVSNFDAQEIYNMVLRIENPNVDAFTNMIKSGKYYLHYDNGGSCVESDIAYYHCTGTVRGGVMTEARWYLAHINDVNGDYFMEENQNEINEIVKKLCPSGDENYEPEKECKDNLWGVIRDWKTPDAWTKCFGDKYKSVFDYLGINEDKRIRIIEKSNDTDFEKEKKLLKAHFLRFIHPFNYFLVPTSKYIFNAVIGHIGEYPPLIRYVRKEIAKECNKNNDLRKYLLEYYKDIMVENPDIINEEMVEDNCNNTKRKEHILFGGDLAISKTVASLEELGFIVDRDDLFKFMSPYMCEGDIRFTYYTKDNEKIGEEKQKHQAKTEVNISYVIGALVKKYKKITEEQPDNVRVCIEDIVNDEKIECNKENTGKKQQNYNSDNKKTYQYKGVTGSITNIAEQIIKDYIDSNPSVCFSELSKNFNLKLGSNSLIILKGRSNSEDYYLVKTIPLSSGEEIKIFKEWSSRYKDKFLKFAEDLGYNITVVGSKELE